MSPSCEAAMTRMRPRSIGEAGLDRQAAPQRAVEVGSDGVPRCVVAMLIGHAKSRQGLTVDSRVGNRFEHVEAAQREDAGNPAEDTGSVVGHDRHDTVLGDDAALAERDGLRDRSRRATTASS